MFSFVQFTRKSSSMLTATHIPDHMLTDRSTDRTIIKTSSGKGICSKAKMTAVALGTEQRHLCERSSRSRPLSFSTVLLEPTAGSLKPLFLTDAL